MAKNKIKVLEDIYNEGHVLLTTYPKRKQGAKSQINNPIRRIKKI